MTLPSNRELRLHSCLSWVRESLAYYLLPKALRKQINELLIKE